MSAAEVDMEVIDEVNPLFVLAITPRIKSETVEDAEPSLSRNDEQ